MWQLFIFLYCIIATVNEIKRFKLLDFLKLLLLFIIFYRLFIFLKGRFDIPFVLFHFFHFHLLEDVWFGVWRKHYKLSLAMGVFFELEYKLEILWAMVTKWYPCSPHVFAYFTVGNLKINLNQNVWCGLCHHVTYKTYKDDEILWRD